MTRLDLAFALVATLSFVVPTPASAAQPVWGQPAPRPSAMKRILRSPVTKKVARGALRVGLAGSGAALLLAAKTSAALGDSGNSTALAIAGLHLMTSSFKGDVTKHLGTDLGLTGAASLAGYLMGSAGDHAGIWSSGLILALGTGVGKLAVLIDSSGK
jgi:hypothetical protein